VGKHEHSRDRPRDEDINTIANQNGSKWLVTHCIGLQQMLIRILFAVEAVPLWLTVASSVETHASAFVMKAPKDAWCIDITCLRAIVTAVTLIALTHPVGALSVTRTIISTETSWQSDFTGHASKALIAHAACWIALALSVAPLRTHRRVAYPQAELSSKARVTDTLPLA